MKHPARVWFPWCVIRLDHFDVSFLPCDRSRHPPWKENGLRRKERKKWKLPDWHSKTGGDYKSRLFYWGRGREDLCVFMYILCYTWNVRVSAIYLFTTTPVCLFIAYLSTIYAHLQTTKGIALWCTTCDMCNQWPALNLNECMKGFTIKTRIVTLSRNGINKPLLR